MTEGERCQREIARVEGLLRSGHPDLDGLLRALVDWRTELRLIRAEAEGWECLATDATAEGGRKNENVGRTTPKQ